MSGKKAKTQKNQNKKELGHRKFILIADIILGLWGRRATNM